MGFGSFLGNIGKSLVSAVPVIGPAISSAAGWSSAPGVVSGGSPAGLLRDAALSVGGDWLMHELIDKPAAATAYGQSKAATAEAYARNVDFYKNRYQWMMQDMKKAGLNPILAAASGMSTSMSPQASPATGFQARAPRSGFASSVRDIAQIPKIRAETQQTLEGVLKTRAETGVASQKEKNLVQEHVKMQNEVVEIISRYNKNMAEVEKLARMAELTEAQKRHEEELLKNTKYMRSQIINMAKKIGYQLAELKRESALYDSAAGMWLKGFEKVLKSAGISIGIVPGLGKRR